MQVCNMGPAKLDSPSHSPGHLAENPQHANSPEGRDQAGRLIGDEGGGDGGRHHRHVEGAPGAGPDPAGVRQLIFMTNSGVHCRMDFYRGKSAGRVFGPREKGLWPAGAGADGQLDGEQGDKGGVEAPQSPRERHRAEAATDPAFEAGSRSRQRGRNALRLNQGENEILLIGREIST